MIAETRESQYEKRRQLEQRLEQDQEELEILQSSLTKTNAFSDKVTGMLSSIDQRLGKLESFIIPIHVVTQKLTKLEERVNQGRSQVENIIALFNVPQEEEPVINGGIVDDDLDAYLTSMKRIKDAISKLQASKYKSAEGSIQGLKELQKRGIKHLDELLKVWLTSISQPLDASTFETKSKLLNDNVLIALVYPAVSQDLMPKLLKLTSFLVLSVSEIGSVSNFAEIYKETREVYLTKSLAESYKTTKEQEILFSGKSTRYEKGSTSLLVYYQRLSWMMKNEKTLIERMFSHPYASFIFSAVVSKNVDSFLEVAESAHTRTKKSVAKREYGDTLMLMDIWDGLSTQTDFSIIEFAGAKGAEIQNFKASIVATMISFIKSFLGEFNTDPGKQSALASDGTIHELTSTTLNTLKRLVDYDKPLGLILASDKSSTFVNISTFPHLVSRIIEALLLDIEIKSKGYKKPVIGTVFLLNNYHYILKNIKSSQLGESIEQPVLINLDKLLLKQMDTYRTNWIACVEFLMDSTNIQDGTIVKTLTAKQKDTIKDKFKGFNDTFEEFIKNSKSYSVPDVDLRGQMVNDIKAVLVPMYNRFFDRYQETEFSKNPEKYIKYKKEAIPMVLNKLYEEATL